MATTFKPHRISSPQLLEHVPPKVLYKLLTKYQDFFVAEQAMPADPDKINYDRLSIVLASPTEQMPPHLMADLFYWDEVASMGNIEDLQEIADKHGINLSANVTIEEAALLVRLESTTASEDLEDLHAQYHAHGLLRKKKRFLSYFAKVDELPKWKKPTKQALQKFVEYMDMWYDSQKKGRGTRVTVVERNGAAWFIVRHGGTFKRENAIENGDPKMVFYRPEAYDLLIYYHDEGELAIFNEGNSIKERRAYCTYLGHALFNNTEFFEKKDANKYTLAPLRTLGKASLDCSNIKGVKSARLTQLRYDFDGENKHCITHRAQDVFEGLNDIGETIPEEACLVCMGVKLTLDDSLGQERSVKLYAPNISVYDHEADAEITHKFFTERQFIISRNGDGTDNS